MGGVMEILAVISFLGHDTRQVSLRDGEKPTSRLLLLSFHFTFKPLQSLFQAPSSQTSSNLPGSSLDGLTLPVC